jgi:WD40 repeat protein
LAGPPDAGGPVVAVEFGTVDDRPVLVSAARDGTVRLWDVDAGTPRPPVIRVGGRPIGIAPLPSGGGLAVAAEPEERHGTVDLWDPLTGRHRRRIRDNGPVEGLRAVPVAGRTLLAWIGFDRDILATTVQLWDPDTATRVASLAWPDPRGALVAPLLVVGGSDRVLLGANVATDCPSHDDDNRCGLLVWWDADTHEEVAREALAWNTRVLAATTVDGAGRIATCEYYHGSRSGRTLGPDVSVRRLEPGWRVDLQGHTRPVRLARFGRVDGRPVLATAGDDAAIRLWDAQTTHRHPAASGPQGSGLAVMSDPTRPLLVVGTAFAYLQLLDATTGAEVDSLHCHGSDDAGGHRCRADEYDDGEHCAGAVAGAPVGGLIASCGRDGSGVVVWDPATGRAVRALDCAANALAFAEIDGRPVLATNNYTGLPTTVWDPVAGERITELPDASHARRWSSSTVDLGTAAGRPVLATGTEYAVNLWDPLTGEHLLSLPGAAERPEPAVIRLAAGHDVVAVADADQVRVWETTTAYELSTIRHPDGPVTCLAVTTVDRRSLLITGDRAGTVRLWDPTTGRLVTTLATFARAVVAVATATVDGRPCVFAQCVSGRLIAARLDDV